MIRAIADLSQLSDPDFFDEIAVGIERLIEGVHQLSLGARSLSLAGQEYPARILNNLAEEEAAKVLILLDAVRCPPSLGEKRSRALRYFYQHLAKGIYVEVCEWGGVLTFGEMSEHIEMERASHYLDGPNNVDWIFPNQILQHREDNLYVNYVREDGNGASRFWTSPANDPTGTLFPIHNRESEVVRLVKAQQETGMTSAKGLSVVASIWRPVRMSAGFDIDGLRKLNLRTLQTMEDQNILNVVSDETVRSVVQLWTFPLYDLDLGMRDVDRSALRDTQAAWVPYDV